MSRHTSFQYPSKHPKTTTSVAGRDESRAYRELLTDQQGRLRVDPTDFVQDVALTNADPIGVSVTNATPLDVSVTNADPMDVALTNTDPIGVIVTNSDPLDVTLTNTSVNISEASLANRIEKPLRAYRREGKCFFAAVQGFTTSTQESLLVLFNPFGSGHKLGVYNFMLSTSTNATGGSGVDWRLRFVHTITTGSNPTESNPRNLKPDQPRDTNTRAITNLDGGIAFGAGTIIGMRQQASGSSGGIEKIIDFQEEILEIPDGYGLQVWMSGNTSNIGLLYSTTFRYIKVPNTEPI